jgi:cell wall-associated NlpC family hydrolase
MNIFFILIFSFISIQAETLLTRGSRPFSTLDKMPTQNIQDIKRFKQNPNPFSQQVQTLNPKIQKQNNRKYNQQFFSPWHISRMHLSKRKRRWQYKFSRYKTYSRWGKRISKKWYQYQIRNSNFKDYESLKKPAITIRHTNIKLYPSPKEIYFNPKRVGEGFPFDYNQNSSLNINTPLFVSHYSLDKKWVYAKSSYAFGWIPIDHIAFVKPAFKKAFENNSYAITIRDNLWLKGDNYKSIVKLGTLFPFNATKNRYLIAKRNRKGYAKLEHVRAIYKGTIAPKPIPFTAQNVAKISKELLHEPYGWGGKLQARDCSSMTRDFFAPFGIYLRRNSDEQIEDGKRVISLRRLSLKHKKARIIKYGKPFRTLLYVKGHIVLYIGHQGKEPIIMHNYWGVRLNSGKKCVLGRCIITSTTPGKELKNIRRRSFLLNTFSKMVIF